MTLQEVYNKVRAHYEILDISQKKSEHTNDIFVLKGTNKYIDCRGNICATCPVDPSVCWTLGEYAEQLITNEEALEFQYKAQK